MDQNGKEWVALKRYWQALWLSALVLMAGCHMEEQKEQPKEWPDTVAFQDEYTRKFLVSPKEVKDGYYLFRSQTGGFTMLFPEEARMDEGLYEKHEKDYERSFIRGSRKKENVAYTIHVIYENDEITEDIDTNLFLLSSKAYADYDGEYKKMKGDKVTIYFAKKERHTSNNGKQNVVYKFFASIKSNHSHQAVQFIYTIGCDDINKKCHIDVAKEEERAKMLMHSIKFQD